MKKILLILLFTLTLFANTDSCKLDVYFGNGVWNNSKQAEKSMKELRRFIQLHYPARFSIADEGVTYDFKYAHNETYGVINDLIETYWQLYESGQISDLYFSFVASALNGIDNTNPNEEAFRQKIRDIISQYNLDTASMLNKYKTESFSQKHNVLLVAHSQGNLFGNKMYELLTDKEKEKFAMVSIATPAGTVAKGGGYTTLHNDPVIKLIPNTLPTNADGSGHTFVDSYLNNPIYSSVESIATNIRHAVDSLDVNSCTKYKYFRWIGFMCPSSQSTELEVDIYGTKDVPFGQISSEELVASDSRVRIALNAQGQCPLQGDDYRTSVSAYDKNGCSAYTFDDTSGNYHSLEYIAGQTYNSFYACTQYKLSVYDTLKDLE